MTWMAETRCDATWRTIMHGWELSGMLLVVMQAAFPIAIAGALAGIVAIARAAARIPAAVPVRVRQRRGTRVVR